MMTLPIQAIEARQREIADEIGRLQAEAADLDAALRVYRKYADEGASTKQPAEGTNKLGPPRPEGAPSLFDMTSQVLEVAALQGQDGLSGREIVERIGSTFWPGVRPQQILPSIYQFAKKGRLERMQDGRFLAPSNTSNKAAKPIA